VGFDGNDARLLTRLQREFKQVFEKQRWPILTARRDAWNCINTGHFLGLEKTIETRKHFSSAPEKYFDASEKSFAASEQKFYRLE